ncbi:MAG TPA: hypothetical protein VFA70_08845 [Dehalococcoidia bacterium]|nr:hypothetical protein [Dehalococcoidia bacterium]
MRAKVIVYELNEVPWEIIDLYVAARPASNLATLVDLGRSYTTVDDDPMPLQPWRTWPTFHKSMYTRDHNSFDLGQDPATFRGAALWDVVECSGLRPGLFGPLQSWPARSFRRGGFYVPDTFSRSPETFPASLERFQAFNLAMTQENGFSSDVPLDKRAMLGAGLDLVTKGLTPWSALRIAAQLLKEGRDARYKARRSVLQVLPCFDLFWRLHRRYRPHLSVFFTNHVAGMMHRFWGDWVPAYATTENYQPDKVYRRFILTAMDYFDHQLGRMLRFVDRRRDTCLIVASSMGQNAIPYRGVQETYVLEQAQRLITALALSAEPGLAMYPRIALKFDSESSAEAATTPLSSVVLGNGAPLFSGFRRLGTTLTFDISTDYPGAEAGRTVRYVPAARSDATDGTLDDLGIVVRPRMGGGNTAYHVPEGIALAYHPEFEPERSRKRVSVLDAAPSILALMRLPPPASMQGCASMFAG